MKQTSTLVLVLALTVACKAQSNFPDVPKTHWAAHAVQELKTARILFGYPTGTQFKLDTIAQFDESYVKQAISRWRTIGLMIGYPLGSNPCRQDDKYEFAASVYAAANLILSREIESSADRRLVLQALHEVPSIVTVLSMCSMELTSMGVEPRQLVAKLKGLVERAGPVSFGE